MQPFPHPVQTPLFHLVKKGKLVASMEILQDRMDKVSPQCTENLSLGPTVHVQIYAAAETTGQVPNHTVTEDPSTVPEGSLMPELVAICNPPI